MRPRCTILSSDLHKTLGYQMMISHKHTFEPLNLTHHLLAGTDGIKIVVLRCLAPLTVSVGAKNVVTN